MRNHSPSGRKRSKAKSASKSSSEGLVREPNPTSVGVALGSGFESETTGEHKAKAAPQTEPPADTTGGSAPGEARPVDRRALRRILTWLLETTTEQQSLILSAMEIVSGPSEGSTYPNDRTQSPGALLRATLAERTASAFNSSSPPSPVTNATPRSRKTPCQSSPAIGVFGG